MLDTIKDYLTANSPEHSRELWSPDMETQLSFQDGSEYRIPKGGNSAEPFFHDHDYHPPADSIRGVGVTGWNWIDKRSEFVTIDLDSIANHGGGHDQQKLDELVQRLSLVDEAEIIRSKSGNGYHVRLYFGDHGPRAFTRAQHIANGVRAFRWLSDQIGGLAEVADAVGVVAWIAHDQKGERGFELLKRSTAFLPDLGALPLPVEQYYDSLDPITPSPAHDKLIKWLTEKGYGEWKDGRLQTHTYALLLATEDKSLGITGAFNTIATGKGGNDDRNCYLHPAENGSWLVYRHGKNTAEHSSWWKSPGGWTVTRFNAGKATKSDPTATIVKLTQDDGLFHDPSGVAYATPIIRGVKETLPVSDSRYRHSLRLRYTAKTGGIVEKKHLTNAIDQITAIAVQERPEYPVAVRIANYNGVLYIDLANAPREVIEVTAHGFRIAENPPVRFYRSPGMLPLPLPLPGGTAADVKQFANVEDDDLPLLLGLIVGAFEPHGPYVVGQIVGEKGSAKTSLSRFIHDFVDPHLAVGNVLPGNAKDLLVVAKSRRLVSFDNLSILPKKISDLLAMLVTGSAISTRRLYTDDDSAVMVAKRPVILTSIGNVVEASDLLDRTLTLVLPTIPPERRRTEFNLNQELMREGVRGRIFGYLLNGVVSALKNHATVKLPRLPRMSDFITWATAAEPGLGLPDGSILAAFERCQIEQSGEVTESQIANTIKKACAEGFTGTPTELANKLALGLTATELGSQLREIAPDLRTGGYTVEFRKTNGRRVVELGVTA